MKATIQWLLANKSHLQQQKNSEWCFWRSMPRGWKWNRINGQFPLVQFWKIPTFERCIEIKSRSTILEKVVAVEELAQNCCGWGIGTVWKPKGRGWISAISSCYQRTGKDMADCEDLSVCCSELQSVWNSDSTRVNCSYELQVSNKSIYKSKHHI
jgi:hypothetical protein